MRDREGEGLDGIKRGLSANRRLEKFRRTHRSLRSWRLLHQVRRKEKSKKENYQTQIKEV